jgi:hypothetical protein
MGETTLVGMRRASTHIAATWCEALSISKNDLVKIFHKQRINGHRIATKLLQVFARRQRLRQLTNRLLMAAAPPFSASRCALVVQRQWSRYAARQMLKDAPLVELYDPGPRRDAFVASKTFPPILLPLAAPPSSPMATLSLKLVDRTRQMVEESLQQTRKELREGTLLPTRVKARRGSLEALKQRPRLFGE